MSYKTREAIDRAVLATPAGRIPDLNQALENTFQAFKQKMQALTNQHGGAYAGIGVRCGAPYRDKADDLEAEFERAMVKVATNYGA